MKSVITQSLAVSLAIAAAIALPTAVKAQADSLSETPSELGTSSEQINTELNEICVRIPGFPILYCFG
ncbi:MAG: hypothetical protein WA885_14050 [Phormidesmis sp.]